MFPRLLILPLAIVFVVAARLAAQTSAPTPPPPRATSPDTVSKITATLPKFSPPPPTDAKPAAPAPDLRETDRPRNIILRLPNYVVREDKVPLFKERELLTPSGRLDLAYKRHPGLHLGSLPFLSNNGIALAMLAEEERIERQKEMMDLAGLAAIGDPAAGAAAKEEAYRLAYRPSRP